MAYLWSVLREEVRGTVDELRQKGALGTLRDAALDTADFAGDAGRSLWDGVRGLVAAEPGACLRASGLPVRGTTAPLEFDDGRTVEALVVDVDDTSDPPRARVTVPGSADVLSVPILPPLEPPAEGPDATPADPAQGQRTSSGSVLDGLRQGWSSTVQDIREKGAVGAMKDTARDAIGAVGSTAASAVDSARPYASQAVDIVGQTAASAVSGARHLASPLIELDRGTPDDAAAAPARSSDDPGAPGSAPPAEDGADAAPPASIAASLLDGLRHEWQETVQDIREKGAIGAVRDAALDTVDIVSGTAAIALRGARSFAGPLLAGTAAETGDAAVHSGDFPDPSAEAAAASAGAASAAQAEPGEPGVPAAEVAASGPDAEPVGELPKARAAAAAGGQSLVSMRRSQFEKLGKDPEEPRGEAEELID